MKQLIKKWIGWQRYKATNHTGTGYTQGIGFDVETEVLEIKRFNLRFITKIKFTVNSQWIRDLKKRWEADEKQQNIEKTNIL